MATDYTCRHTTGRRVSVRVRVWRARAFSPRPTTDDQRPTTNGRRPTTDDRRPTTVDRRPSTAYGFFGPHASNMLKRMVATTAEVRFIFPPENRPLSYRPTTNDQRPLALFKGRSPSTVGQRPDQRPTTDDQRPKTNDRRPSTVDRRPDRRPTTAPLWKSLRKTTPKMLPACPFPALTFALTFGIDPPPPSPYIGLTQSSPATRLP
jgi:hypothetical protein